MTSDCWAIRDFHENHHVTDTAPESAAMALLNGCDLNCGNTYLHMLAAVQEGLVTEENITESAIRLFTTRYLLGLFDPICEWNAIPYSEVDTDAHNALAERAAEKAMVLLRNNGILPLDPENLKAVAVIGPMAASDLVLKGNYYGTAARSVTLLEGIRAYLEPYGVRVYYSAGCDRILNRQENLAQPDDRLAEAAICAEQADVVIACVGLDETLEGEEGDTGNFSASGDKVSLALPESQQRLMKVLAGTGKPLVTVLTVGSSLNVPEGDAEILAWYPGQAGGSALASILFGEVSPSGCLPVTFYKGLEDIPEFTDYAMTNRTYRYFTGEPLYPFGFGLSYTTFAVEAMRAETDRVFLTVRNTGAMDAETVAQVYVKPENCADAPVHPVLAGFARAAVPAGEAVEITCRLNPDAFTVVNDAGERVAPGGAWDLWAGLHQPDALSERLSGNACLHTRLTL